MSNFADLVAARGREAPDRLALVLPGRGGNASERISFGGLGARVKRLTGGLADAGIEAGMRVLVLVPLSQDLYAVALALMARGATVVLADPGQPRRRFGECIASARPHAVVGTRRTLRLRLLVPALRRIPRRLSLDGGLWTRRLRPGAPVAPAAAHPETPALITFTSGSTGAPKGVVRTHGTLSAQHHALSAAYPPLSGEVVLTPFPVVALHNLCAGVTTVLPDLPGRDVSAVRPVRVAAQAKAEGVTTLLGPPAFLRPIAQAVLEGAEFGGTVTFPGVRRVGVGGAPVDAALCRMLRAAFPEAEGGLIYGSTEAEPVAGIDLDAAIAAYAAPHQGYVAGVPAPAAEVRLAPLGGEAPGVSVPEGTWGEVLVTGPHVCRAYFEQPAADARHKVTAPDGRVWHRMGDVARFDAHGVLWLGGRSDRLVRGAGGLLAAFPVEASVRAVAGVTDAVLHTYDGRTYLWYVGAPHARAGVEHVLRANGVSVDAVAALAALPRDRRHRSKVDYEALDATARRRPHQS